MISVLSRILLRYGAGAVFGPVVLQKFGIDPAALANDPDVQIAVAGVITVGIEGWSWLAHKLGWPT